MTVLELIGRALVAMGAMLLVVGALLLVIGRIAPDGRLLPGDIVIRRPGFTLYFPLATMIVVSLLLTGLGWLIAYLRR
jgi:hypothetical protein